MFNIEAIRQALRTMELSPAIKDREEVARQWKKLAIRYHPDKNRAPDAAEKFKRVHSAWELVQKYLEGGGRLPLPKPPKARKRPKPGRVQTGPATVPVAGAVPQPRHPFHNAPMPEPPAPVYAGGFVVDPTCDPLLQALFNGIGLGGVSPVQIMQDVAASILNPPPMCPEDGFVFGNGVTVGAPWSFGNAPQPTTIHPWSRGARPVPPPPPPPGYTRIRVGPARRRRRPAPGPEVVAHSTRQATEAAPGTRPHRASTPYAGAQVKTASRAQGRAWFEVTAEEMKRFGRDTGAGARPGRMQGTLLLPGRDPMHGCYDVEIRNGVPVVDGVTCTFRTVKR